MEDSKTISYSNVVKKNRDVSTSFLKADKVIVQFIPKPTKEISNKNHIAYGRKLEGTFDFISPPRLRKDKMQNILTNEEKEGLEYLMKRDLSIYGDFWKSWRKGGMFPIALGKDDMELDLGVAEDYIKYKVLLNSAIVANSTDQLKNEPRETYKYVLVKENESEEIDAQNIDDTAKAFAFYSENATNKDALRYILTSIGKNTHKTQTLDFLRGEVGKAIMVPKDKEVIIKLANDKDFKIKVMLEKAVSLGVIDRVSGMYYTKENEAIAGEGEEPTIDAAARFLTKPIGQEMRLSIETRIKNAKE